MRSYLTTHHRFSPNRLTSLHHTTSKSPHTNHLNNYMLNSFSLSTQYRSKPASSTFQITAHHISKTSQQNMNPTVLKTTSLLATLAFGAYAIDRATASRNHNVIWGINGQLDQLNTQTQIEREKDVGDPGKESRNRPHLKRGGKGIEQEFWVSDWE